MRHLLFVCLCFVWPVEVFGWKMEADIITVVNTEDDTVTHIVFRQPFDTTPLVFTLMDDTGPNPASFRLKNITTTGFDIYTVEPPGEDGPHATMYTIPYIAVEPGDHTLPDGSRFLAETVNTHAFQSRLIAGSSWEHVDLSGFSTTPMVLGQIQTRVNERTDEPVPDAVSQPWITTVIENVTDSGFDIALDRSETIDGDLDQDETIAYLVMESGLNEGTHYFGSNDAKKIEYETIRSEDIIKGWDNGDYRIDFSKSYDDPVAVATKNTRHGSDGGWLRRGEVGTDYITLQIDEDRARDSERSHVTERAGLLIFSEPFDAEFLPTSDARMVINEVMYNETVTGADNDEFVELYVLQSGNIQGYVLSDQDSHYYQFPFCNVQKGEYVIFHTGGDPVNNSCSGTVKHFYQGVSQYWNNSSGDDVLLLRTAANDVTIDGYDKVFNASVEDYIAYSLSSASAYDPPPTSMKGTTANWDDSYSNELDNAADGVSIALTPNARDSDTSACWEFSASGNASDNGCSDYLPTKDIDPTVTYTHSLGVNNNSFPEMHITKSSIVIDDPVNGTTDPKRIPGATIRYCFTVDNNGTGDAEDVVIHDTLNGGGRDNLVYIQSGHGGLVSGSGPCSEDDCKAITDTSGSYDSSTKQVDINLTTPFTAGDHECAYIEVTID